MANKEWNSVVISMKNGKEYCIETDIKDNYIMNFMKEIKELEFGLYRILYTHVERCVCIKHDEISSVEFLVSQQ